MKFKIPIKKRYIFPVVILILALIYLVIAIISSGVIFSGRGILYLILNFVIIAGLIFCGKKFYDLKKEERRIEEIINDPQKIYDKLTGEGNKFIDDGKEFNISLKNNKETGKKELDFSIGKEVKQDWRKKYEVNPIEQNQEKKVQDKKKVQDLNKKDPKKGSKKKTKK